MMYEEVGTKWHRLLNGRAWQHDEQVGAKTKMDPGKFGFHYSVCDDNE
jgi:hypothetical protein